MHRAAVAGLFSIAFGFSSVACGGDGASVEDDSVTAEDLAAHRFTNPILPDCADPGVMRQDASGTPTFYLTCTQSFDVKTSHDLVHWKTTGHLFDAPPPWRADGKFWAPEIHHLGARYVVLYTAQWHDARMAIGAAFGDQPDGPFVDIGHPLVTDPVDGVIDPNLFNAPDGRHYVYFKTDGNGHGHATHLWGQEITADGRLLGERQRLLTNDTASWEGPIIEAPWVVHHDGEYYLFYSGNGYWGAQYAVGVAKSRSPLGGFEKRGEPILHSDRRFEGPGHEAVVRQGARDFIVYHAYSAGKFDQRHLMLDPIVWEGGWPRVANDSPSLH